MGKKLRAQSLTEYVLMVSIITGAIVVLFPMVKRGHQSMIKVVADLVGNQKRSEQDFATNAGHLVSSNTRVRSATADVVNERGSGIRGQFLYNHVYGQTTDIATNESTSQGFTED